MKAFFRNLECPLQGCREKNRSKVHTLIKKDKPLCLHTLLGYSIPQQDDASQSSSVKPKQVPKIDREATVKHILEKITEHVPSMTNQAQSDFLARNHQYTNNLVLNENISEIINNTVPTKCSYCENSELISWPYKPKTAFFLRDAFQF